MAPITTKHPSKLETTVDDTRQTPDQDFETKCVFSYRTMQAVLLKCCVPEFQGETLEWICKNAFVAEPPVNKKTFDEIGYSQLNGDSPEHLVYQDGHRYMDILYRVKTPSDEVVLVNVEIQGDFFKEQYPKRRNRAQYHSAMLTTRQNGRLFGGDNFQDIVKTYTIWIYTCPTKGFGEGMRSVSYEAHDLIGRMEAEDYDRNNIICIYLQEAEDSTLPTASTNGEINIMYFLREVLLSHDKDRALSAIRSAGVPTTPEFEEEVEEMCTASVGTFMRGEEKGELNFAFKCVDDGDFTLRKAAEKVDLPLEEFQKLYNQHKKLAKAL